VAGAAAQLGVIYRTVNVKDQDQAPAEGIVATIAAEGCDLVAMAQKVVALSPVSVLVCR
jgi:hypothetical protein